MCITFFYCNPAPRSGLYRLVLAFNRDEYLDRATAKAEWDDQGKILCGRDATQGKEGGTWLAVDRRGRLGFVTNIFTGSREVGAKGRGFLVLDYLKGDKSAKDYLESVAAEEAVYNPFNLCLFEPDADGVYSGRQYVRGKPGHVVQSESPTGAECIELTSQTFSNGSSMVELIA